MQDGNKPADLALTHEQHDIAALLNPEELKEEEEAEGMTPQEQPQRGRLQGLRRFFRDFQPRHIKLVSGLFYNIKLLVSHRVCRCVLLRQVTTLLWNSCY